MLPFVLRNKDSGANGSGRKGNKIESSTQGLKEPNFSGGASQNQNPLTSTAYSGIITGDSTRTAWGISIENVQPTVTYQKINAGGSTKQVNGKVVDSSVKPTTVIYEDINATDDSFQINGDICVEGLKTLRSGPASGSAKGDGKE